MLSVCQNNNDNKKNETKKILFYKVLIDLVYTNLFKFDCETSNF